MRAARERMARSTPLLYTCVLLACAALCWAAASNSLSDCQAFAANFNNSCDPNAGPLPSLAAHPGMTVTCTVGGANQCPGTQTGNTCVFQHKLCVTCSVQNGKTRIRVQSNGNPPRCTMGQITSRNIDFEVNYNPDVTFDPNTLTQNPLTQTQVNNLLCVLPSPGSPYVPITVPSWSNITYYTSDAQFFTLVGIAVDGVMVLKTPSADNQDPFYPTTAAAPPTDMCLSHGTEYHYHSPSYCQISPPTNNPLSMCSNVPACANNVKQYMLTNVPNIRRVIGVAMDGHAIFTPYDALGNFIAGGYDVCNGMFYDASGNYAYIGTNTMPYVPSCFGPASYPCARPTCTTNPLANFSRSAFLPQGACTGTNAGATVQPAYATVAVLLAALLALAGLL